MSVKHQPATPLPWSLDADDDGFLQIDGAPGAGDGCMVLGDLQPVCDRSEISDDHECFVQMQTPDMAYIVHAANAYPKLVEALRTLAFWDDNVLVNAKTFNDPKKLLRELGETQ